MYTPQFSPSAFFHAMDEFHSGTGDTNQDTNPHSSRIGETLVVSSTQTMLDKCKPIFPPCTALSHRLPNLQDAAEGVTHPPAGRLQMSLKTHVGLKGSSSIPDTITLPSNLVFIQ
ncbi:hypothetical protein BDR04DRAFT_1151232 [Suillus decipiens]|nr:hypothetical protein BDR04DRAFT_1151232 [Suillus decipiens]